MISEITQEIRQILNNARSNAYKAINSAMVIAYWHIGKLIVEKEQFGNVKAKYGEFLLKELSKNLTKEFGKGFSYSNLRNFRQFYLTYPDESICYTLCSKLSWSHNRIIMRISEKKARDFYLSEVLNRNWSTRQLERNISSLYYQRLLSSHVLNETIPDSTNENFRDFIKDPYIFEFLGLDEAYQSKENQLEAALIENLNKFLMELGKGFSFVGRQYRISTEIEHFYIDLVFYNFILKCFVLIDLKVGKLTHQDIGQKDMYRRMFDDLQKSDSDNPTIGILLCTEKSETVVKYSILSDTNQLFVSKYLLYLPTEQELIAEIERQKARFNIIRDQIDD